MGAVAPVWILAYPRTGSTYLADMLNATGLFDPRFHEWRPVARKIVQFPYNKIMWWQVGKVGSLDVVDRELPGVRYLHLRRRDLVGQAVSHYISRMTLQFHARSDDELFMHMATTVPVFRGRLMRFYRRAVQQQRCWESMLGDRPRLDLWYEDLAETTEAEMQRVFDYLGIDFDPAQAKAGCNIRKNCHPQTPALRKVIERRLQRMGSSR